MSTVRRSQNKFNVYPYFSVCWLSFANHILNQLQYLLIIFSRMFDYPNNFINRFPGNNWIVQSVQRLATGWTFRGSNPGGDEIFRTCPGRPWEPPGLLYNGYRVFPAGIVWSGRDADSSPSSSAVVMKRQSYTSTPPMGRTDCTEPQCLYKGALYLTLPRS